MSVASPIKKVLDFIIYSNLFISSGVAAFTLQTALFFPQHTAIIEEFSILNFIATFVLYNLQRLYYASHENLNEKYNWYNRHRRLVFTGIVLLFMSFFNQLLDFFLQHADYFFAYLFLAALSIFYFLPPLQLRKYGSLKPFIIAFVFVVAGILLPLYAWLNVQLLIYALGQFCFIASLCILFDVKDLPHDQQLKVNTFPLKFGLHKTKYAAAFLVLTYAGSAMFNPQAPVIISYSMVSALTLVAVFFAKPTNSIYYYFYLVDGLILLQYFLLQGL